MNKNSLSKFAMYIISCFFSLLITAITIYLVYKYAVVGFQNGLETGDDISKEKEPKQIEIELKDATSTKELAAILKENGVIDQPFVFWLEAKLQGFGDTYEKGTYLLDAAMNNNEINSALVNKGSVYTDKVITIIEGARINGIATLLEEKGIVSKEDFINECENGEFDYEFLKDVPDRPNRLEGYLFPDTYFVSNKADSREIINKMLKRYEQIYNYDRKDRAQELGLTMDQVIIIASMLEKEIKVPEEREIASSVIYNRLANEQKLQMCSTVIYVLGKNRDYLTAEDLKVDSPYNTYLNDGLPLGPICNPGEACIDAALYPAATDYMYFVAKDNELSEHFFTNNYDEFLEAKKEYKQNY